MQTKDPCVFSQDNQMDHPTMDIVVQTDAKEDIPIGYWMIQQVAEAVVQTDPMETQEAETQTEETPAYTPLIREEFISKLQNELLEVQQKLAQYKEEVVPPKIQQELKKYFVALTIIEDETFAQFRVEQKKVEKERDKLQKAKQQLEAIFSLYSNTLSCRAPSTNYALYLLERFLLLKIKAANTGKPVEIKTTPDFV